MRLNYLVRPTMRAMFTAVLLISSSPSSAQAQTAATDPATEPVIRTKTFLHENGAKLSEGRFVDDDRDGPWTWWYDTGEEFASMTYDKGTPVGTERHLTKSGDVITTGEYRDGTEFNGTFVDFDGKLQLTSMRTYQEGNPQGKWQWWHSDGSLNTEGVFVDGQKDGTWLWYYPNGQKFAETNFENGALVGRESHWSSAGDLITTGEYRDGSPWTGQFVDFLGADLVVTFQRSFLEGKPHGEWIWRYKDGTLNTLGGFVNGEKDGRWEWWYEDGTKFAETNYMIGVSQGKLSHYANDGTLLAEGIYNAEGQETNGTFVDFTSELVLTAQRTWNEGTREGHWIEWYENGQQKSESHYTNGRQTGTWTTWSEEGVKTSEERFGTE